jgi:hypothetical protein
MLKSRGGVGRGPVVELPAALVRATALAAVVLGVGLHAALSASAAPPQGRAYEKVSPHDKGGLVI